MKQLIKTTLIRTLWVAPLLAAGLAIGCAGGGDEEQSAEDAAIEAAGEVNDGGEDASDYPKAPEATE
jgi:hypothetical protein